jgi:osmotically-inducible protein OsmY
MKEPGRLTSDWDSDSNVIDRLEAHVQCRLGGRVREFRVDLHDGGLVLRGRVHTYHAKQLAQQAVMEATPVPIVANEIEVS